MASPLSCERHLSVGGTSNFRDLGGYLTADKKHCTRWHRVFRSDHLQKVELTIENQALMCDTLHIKYTVDFRGAEEKAREPYAIPGITTLPIPIEPGNVMYTLFAHKSVTEEAAVKCMCDLYELFVTDFQAQYTQFLRFLLEKGAQKPEIAVDFHCTAGKDRTGFGAALLLLVLGVDLDTVMEDYLLTNKYYRPIPYDVVRRSMSDVTASDAALDALFFVRKEYLLTSINLIDKKYGGVDNFVTKTLGFSPQEVQQLKDCYLMPI